MSKITPEEIEFVQEKSKTFFFSTMSEICSKKFDQQIFLNIIGSSLLIFLNTVVTKGDKKIILNEFLSNLLEHNSFKDE